MGFYFLLKRRIAWYRETSLSSTQRAKLIFIWLRMQELPDARYLSIPEQSPHSLRVTKCDLFKTSRPIPRKKNTKNNNFFAWINICNICNISQLCPHCVYFSSETSFGLVQRWMGESVGGVNRFTGGCTHQLTGSPTC